jgi:predicted Rossmann fold flavoprotein
VAGGWPVTAGPIAIVGGGAAGLMAAAAVLERQPDARLTLFERNPRLGAKVIISGGGRCNVTTGVTDVRAVLTRYPRGARWLRHALHSFPPAAVVDWFERHGVPLKTEPDLRVFPVSDNGRDVVAAFERLFRRSNVHVRLRAPVSAVERGDDSGFAVVTPAGRERVAALIITTGGAAFQHTGSRGDGFTFARALGHTVTPLFPSLNAYVAREPWVRDLAGVSLTDALLTIPARAPGGPAYRFRGPFLFTHWGVTGPAVFALCALAAKEPYDAHRPLPLRINLLPDHGAERVDGLLRERLAALGGRELVNTLDTLLPRSLCPVVCAVAGVDPGVRSAGATARSSSPPAASRSTRSTRARCAPRSCRGCTSPARCWTWTASPAATTSRRPGPRAGWQGYPPQTARTRLAHDSGTGQVRVMRREPWGALLFSP